MTFLPLATVPAVVAGTENGPGMLPEPTAAADE